MKLTVVPEDDPTPGIDRTKQPTTPELIAQFAAYVVSNRQSPGGDMSLTIHIPFAQIPNVHPLMKHVAGTVFRVTVEQVPFDEMPESEW